MHAMYDTPVMQTTDVQAMLRIVGGAAELWYEPSLQMQFTLGAAVIVAAALACAVPRLGTMWRGKTPPIQGNQRV